MSKRFNDTGNCIPHRHYMADVSAKLDKAFFMQLENYALATGYEELDDLLKKHKDADKLTLLERFIMELTRGDRKVVLMIDEVDSASNNQLFLDFLGLFVRRVQAERQDHRPQPHLRTIHL